MSSYTFVIGTISDMNEFRCISFYFSSYYARWGLDQSYFTGEIRIKELERGLGEKCFRGGEKERD